MTNEELEIWRKLNECEAVGRVKGLLEFGDLVTFRNKIGRVSEMQVNHDVANKREYTMVHVNQIGWILEQYITWIPPLFNPICPERSLIGIYKSITGGIVKSITFTDNRPDLALARVIIEQEGK